MYEQGKGYNKNLQAFLKLISYCENYQWRNKKIYPYKVGNSGQEIKSLIDHPSNISGQINKTSSSAGAYQFLKGTWNNLSDKIKLKDFSEKEQDRAAVELIKEKGQLSNVENGYIEDAMYWLGGVQHGKGTTKLTWECFNKMYFENYPVTWEQALQYYKQQGGILFRKSEFGYIADEITITPEKENNKKKSSWLWWLIGGIVGLTGGIIIYNKKHK